MTDANFTITSPVLTPGESFLVKYRLQPAVIWTQLTPNPITNTFVIPNLADGCYDFTVQKVKSDGTVCANLKAGTFCIGPAGCCTPSISSVSLEDVGASRLLTINYDASSCTPAPDSIRVYYRQKGSSDPYTVGDGFITSPIIINDVQTEFEGYIVGLCGETEAAAHSAFETSCAAPAFSMTWNPATNTISITVAPGNYQYSVVNSTDNCADTPVISGTISGNTSLPFYYLGTFKLCLRSVCGPGVFSPWASSPNFANGNPAQLIVGLGENETLVCGSAFTVYLQPPATIITNGVQLFSDPALTSPVLFYNLVKEPGGTIFALDPLTGIVLNPTGSSC